MTLQRTHRQRGISLIEALVAMIVLSFGTLAVLGVQATLRSNSDVSKQRSEAVRIGQQALEQWRSYEAIDGDAEGIVYFDDLADDEFSVDGTNASYEVARMVSDDVDDPRRKTVAVDVSWTDRNGETQTVRLRSALGGVPPELVGTLVIPSGTSVLRNPGNRHPSVPTWATPQEGGTSKGSPPGAPDGVAWVFNNSTGFITQVCNAEICSTFNARLLSGFIRFALDANPNGETPSSPRKEDLEVSVDQTHPLALAGTTVQCYEDTEPTGYMPYYCAVPLDTQIAWSGRTRFSGLDIADEIEDDDDDEYKICRYTPYRSHKVVPTEMRNDEHPLNYVLVEVSLTNQNYLVIRAGQEGDDGDVAIACPDDDTDTPLIDGTTWHHQPAN
jgi:Tfp pilus assembly protein PilV